MGGRPETGTPKKGKVRYGIAFEPGMKPGRYPEAAFLRVTLPSKNKDKGHATYVSMSVKLPASKKTVENLQHKLSELVHILLHVYNNIDILTFDK